jgi:hypothetical protein
VPLDLDPPERPAAGAGARAASFLGTVSPRLSVGGGDRALGPRRVSMGLRFIDLTGDNDDPADSGAVGGGAAWASPAGAPGGAECAGGDVSGAGTDATDEVDLDAGDGDEPTAVAALDAGAGDGGAGVAAAEVLRTALAALGGGETTTAAGAAASADGGAAVAAAARPAPDPLTVLKALHAAAQLGLLRPPPAAPATSGGSCEG